MSRVLVIKNANFSANRVAVIDLDSSIPCTGIEFAESTITVTGDEAVTIEYTLTPSDTTDEVSWASSDTSVATVSDGVVAILGIGATTLTATCGSYSATAVLTADLYASPDWYQSTSSIITDSDGHSIVRADLGLTASVRMFAAQEEENTLFELPFLNGGADSLASAYPIRIPLNCERIQITASNLYNNSAGSENHKILFVNATTPVTYENTVTSCEAISLVPLIAASNAMSEIVNIPENASGFAIALRLRNTPSEGTTMKQAGESTSLSVHFLPAAS